MTSEVSSEARSGPTPLAWWNLHRWIRETRRVDDRRYSPRPQLRHGGGLPARVGDWIRPSLEGAVFIVGAPRSGTSFLGEVCASLPELSYHYEPPMIKAATRYVYERQWSEPRARLFFRATYRWLLRRHGDGHLRLAEKTPQNCFIIDFLARSFPDARFVHIVRDGRDAALSYTRTEWLSQRSAGSGKRESGGYLIGPVPRYWVERERRDEFAATSDLHRCIWAWRRHTESALERLADLDSSRVHELRFEDWVHPERRASEATALLDFLDISHPASRQAFQTRLGQGRPDRVGDAKKELGSEERATVDAEAGDLLRRLGYA